MIYNQIVFKSYKPKGHPLKLFEIKSFQVCYRECLYVLN